MGSRWIVFIIFLSFQGVHADLDSDLNATNITIYSAESTISQLDVLISNYSFLGSDLETTIKQSEAKSKISTSKAYYQSAVGNKNTSPDLAATFNNLARADAEGAKTLADSAILLANAKILGHIATEEETRVKIERVSKDLDSVTERLESGNLTLRAYEGLLKNLSIKGQDIASAEEKLEEARILLERAGSLYNSSMEYFSKDLDKAALFSDDALKALDEFDFRAHSAYNYAMILQKSRAGKKEDIELLLNESQVKIEDARRRQDSALEAIRILDEQGVITTGLGTGVKENSRYLKSASSFVEKAILRYNIGDYESSKEFILDAFDSLGAFNSRQDVIMDSILSLLGREMLDKQNSTRGSIERASREVDVYADLFSKNHTDFAFSKISRSRSFLNNGEVLLEDAKINRENKKFEDAVSDYAGAYQALELSSQEIDSLDVFINVTTKIALLEENRQAIGRLSLEKFSGLNRRSVDGFDMVLSETLQEYENQNYSMALEYADDALEKSDALITAGSRNVSSGKHVIALSLYSLFLIVVIVLLETFSRRIK